MAMNKTNLAAQERKLVDAIGAHFKGSDALTLDGVAYKAKDIAQMLQAHLDAESAAEALRSQWLTAVAAARESGTTVTGILPALRSYLITQYGGTSQTVRDFGFTPKERATTVAAQAEGIAKRAATRKARGTKGKRQKEAIVGTVAPTTAPAADPKPTTAAVTAGQSANSATS